MKENIFAAALGATLMLGAALALAVALAMPATAGADEIEPCEEPEASDWAVDTAETGAGDYVADYEAGYGADDFRTMGVVYGDDGRVYTWYSENVLPGYGLYELNANGRHVDEDGYVVDGDGYIAVASPWGDPPIGTVVETPFGTARVYDTCEGDTFDIYTSW